MIKALIALLFLFNHAPVLSQADAKQIKPKKIEVVIGQDYVETLGTSIQR